MTVARRPARTAAWQDVSPPRPLVPVRLSPRKEQILDELEQIVLVQGFRSLRLTDVAQQLNASYATLYAIAPTKEELVLLVVDRWYSRAIASAQRQLARAKGPVKRLELWIEYGVAGVTVTGQAFWADVATHAALNQLVESYSHYYVEVLEAVLNEGVAEGVFRKVNTRALAVYWEAAGASLRDEAYLQRLQGMPIPELAQLWVDLILHGILKD